MHPKSKRLLLVAVLGCLLHLVGSAQAPTLTVHGTVQTDKGIPIPDASISIAGTAKGAISDSKGVFSLPAPANALLLIPYATTKRKDLTGSVAVVSEKDFQGGTITTPEQLIAGKVAGVSVTSN